MSIIPGHRVILHGGDYNPEQWKSSPEIWERDFELMREAGTNTFTLGVFSWAQYEPREGVFEFGWLDHIMDRMAEEGHRVILATPSGARPPWMAKKYPEVRRVNQQGLREPFQHRHNHCWQSPIYRTKVREINSQLVARYGAHPALGMWHISNELSGDCYCELCQRRWWRWLEERYGSLDALNAAWWTTFWSHTFTAWDEIDPRADSMDGLALDWRRFNTHQIIEWYRWEADPIRSATPQIPITTNFMGALFPTDYAAFGKEVDVITDDQYPEYDGEAENLLDRVTRVAFKNDLFRSFKPGRPWMLMECAPDAVQWRPYYRFKDPALHRAEMFQALGHGAEGTCYFQWRKSRGAMEKLHSAVVDHVGHSGTRVFKQVAEVGRSYAKLNEILDTQVSQARVGVIYDWESWWAYDRTCGTPSRNDTFQLTAVEHYRPWWNLGIGVDVISSTDDFTPYRVLVLPQMWMLKRGVAARLKSFVQAGGVVLMTANSAVCDETNLCLLGGMPGDGLREVFGVWVEEVESLPPELKRVIVPAEGTAFSAAKYEADCFASVVHAEGAEVLANYANSFYAGTPALTVHRFGEGRAYYLAARFDRELLQELADQVADALGLERFLGEGKPSGVSVQAREAGSMRILFVQNFNDDATTVPLPEFALEDLETGVRHTNALPLDAFSSGVFRIVESSV